MTEDKICATCKEQKPISEFYKNSKAKDGICAQCKSCCKQYRDIIRSKDHQERSVCKWCESPFERKPGFRLYCSYECRLNYRQQSTTKPQHKSRVCKFCKKEFNPKRADQVYCSATCREGMFHYLNPTKAPEYSATTRFRAKADGRLTTAQDPEYQREYRAKLKKQVFDGYGNFCNCCGLRDIRFLTVDHVNNDGMDDYTGSPLHSRIIREGFPPRYQLLCWNCNCAKNIHGGVCPHQLDKEVGQVA